jgi:hypothetical protein
MTEGAVHRGWNPKLNQTLELIFEQLGKSGEVRWILDKYGLRATDPYEAARKIHAFTRANLKYKLDEEGEELVRSAAYSWRDRLAGVDCEDMTIFQGSLMKEQGHGAYVWLTVVDLDSRKPGMEHIYPSFLGPYDPTPKCHGPIKLPYPMGTAFDSLLEFGKHPDGILMSLQLLSLGNISRCGGPARPMAGLAANLTGANKRKAEWIHAADPAVRRAIAAIMPFVVDLKSDGTIIWKPGTSSSRVAALITQNMPAGLGAAKKKKKEDKRSVLQTVTRITPTLILGRNAFLLMVRANAFKLGTHLRLVFMDPETARRSKLDLARLKKAMDQRPKIEKAWKNLGGDLNSLRKAIAAASHTELSKLDGLGTEPVSAASALAAAPVLAVIIPIVAAVPWKEIVPEGGQAVENDPTGKKLNGKALADGVAALIQSVKLNSKATSQATTDAIAAIAAGDNSTDDTPSPGKDTGSQLDDPKDKTWLWILGGILGLGAIGGGIYLYSKSNSNRNGSKKGQQG